MVLEEETHEPPNVIGLHEGFVDDLAFKQQQGRECLQNGDGILADLQQFLLVSIRERFSGLVKRMVRRESSGLPLLRLLWSR